MATVIFDCLIELMDSGEKGRQLALAALENAIRILYGFTEDAKLAFEHFRLCLKTGDATDDQAKWLRDAIDRTLERAKESPERPGAGVETEVTEAQNKDQVEPAKIEGPSPAPPRIVRAKKPARSASKKKPNSNSRRRAACRKVASHLATGRAGIIGHSHYCGEDAILDLPSASSRRRWERRQRREEIGGAHDANTLIEVQREQVAAVSGDDVFSLAGRGAIDDLVIVRIGLATDGGATAFS